jgi:hypothetical protein
VTHRGFDRGEVDASRDEQRPVRVAQIVKAHRTKAHRITRPFDAPPHRRAVEPASKAIREDVVVGAGEVTALRKTVERAGGLVGKRDLTRSR